MEQAPSFGDLPFPDDLLDALHADYPPDELLDLDGIASFLDDLKEDSRVHIETAFGSRAPASHGLVTTADSQRLHIQPFAEGCHRSSSNLGPCASSEFTTGLPCISGVSNIEQVPMAAMPLSSADQQAAAAGRSSGDDDAAREVKRRARNDEQTEHNRIAQQKYRDRKKQENKELQHTIEQLKEQIAKMKTIEARTKELQVENAGLVQKKFLQKQHLENMESKVADRETTISTQATQLSGQLALLNSQQPMIMEQYQKLQLQEELLTSLKARLESNLEAAWEQPGVVDQATICRKMHDAVRSALMDAKGLEALQEKLIQLPESLVVEICRNVLRVCMDMFPGLAKQLQKNGNCALACASAAGPLA